MRGVVLALCISALFEGPGVTVGEESSAAAGGGPKVGAAADDSEKTSERGTAFALKPVAKRLRQALGDLDPLPFFTDRDNTLIVEWRTRKYLVHARSKSGEIAAEAWEELGPSPQGFLLRVHAQPAGTVNAAQTPQTLHFPYWETYLDLHEAKGSNWQLFWGFSYGSRTDKKLLEKIQAAIAPPADGDAVTPGAAELEGVLRIHPKFVYKYYLDLGNGQTCALDGNLVESLPEGIQVRVRGPLEAKLHAGGTKENPSPFGRMWIIKMAVQSLEDLSRSAKVSQGKDYGTYTPELAEKTSSLRAALRAGDTPACAAVLGNDELAALVAALPGTHDLSDLDFETIFTGPGQRSEGPMSLLLVSSPLKRKAEERTGGYDFLSVVFVRKEARWIGHAIAMNPRGYMQIDRIKDFQNEFFLVPVEMPAWRQQRELLEQTAKKLTDTVGGHWSVAKSPSAGLRWYASGRVESAQGGTKDEATLYRIWPFPLNGNGLARTKLDSTALPTRWTPLGSTDELGVMASEGASAEISQKVAASLGLRAAPK